MCPINCSGMSENPELSATASVIVRVILQIQIRPGGESERLHVTVKSSAINTNTNTLEREDTGAVREHNSDSPRPSERNSGK